MSYHSEEIWESFDALWRQIRVLNSRVRELEARLGVADDQGLRQPRAGFKPPDQVLRESNKTDFVYEGD
jgi:hypothetical protein